MNQHQTGCAIAFLFCMTFVTIISVDLGAHSEGYHQGYDAGYKKALSDYGITIITTQVVTREGK